jgi:tetratricopeptide (TPR) repeat protein
MPLATPVSVALGRFGRLPQRAGEVWQGGIVRLPMWIDDPADPEGPPQRASGAIWVSLRTGLVHMDLAKEGEEATPELALATLLEFGLKLAKELDGRPARIEVRDPGLRDVLAASLAALDTTVTLVDDQPAVRDALRTFEEHEVEEPMPGLMDVPGMAIDRVRAFAAAAAAFYSARPWDRLTSEDLVLVESAKAPPDMRHLSVLGQDGQEFGIDFFDSRRAFERLLDEADPDDMATRAHGVTFGPIDGLPFADVDAWQDHDLPVAGREAYPLAADLNVDESPRRPSPRALSYTEGLLRALAETTDDELDAGAWQKRVETFDGPLDLRLSLPLLLEGEQARAPDRYPLPPFLKRAPAPAREPTPLQRAQELAYDAMEQHGRLRIKRARQALAISQDCADAWVLLAEAASTPETAVELYERGMQAGVAAIGAERFESLRGAFWGHVKTRPYMRARLGLAQALAELERHADAIAHYRALLELNPEDNQGVRYLLLAQLLEQGSNDDAGRLLAEYEDDAQALWAYGRLLWRFRTQGDSAATREAFAAAAAANQYAVKYLLDPESMLPSEAPSFTVGSRDEGAYVADMLFAAYEATNGALEWLEAQTPRRRRSRSRPGRRGR